MNLDTRAITINIDIRGGALFREEKPRLKIFIREY